MIQRLLFSITSFDILEISCLNLCSVFLSRNISNQRKKKKDKKKKRKHKIMIYVENIE